MSAVGVEPDIMNPEDKWRLTSNRTYLLDNLDVEHVSNWLLTDGIFNEDDLEELSVIPNPRDRSAKLLNWLPRKGPNAYGIFRRCLAHSPTQRYIIPFLDGTDFSRMPRNAAADITDASRAGGPSRQTGQQYPPVTHGHNTVRVRGNSNIVIAGASNVTINR